MNKSELILDKVRSLNALSLDDGKLLLRLTSLEDSSLQCTAEGEEVTDAIGAVITTLYRAKRATFSATNSLVSLDLAAAQYGSTKEVFNTEDTGDGFTDYTYEILTVDAATHKITLSKTPIEAIKYIYQVTDGEIATVYTADTAAGALKFTHTAGSKDITLAEGVTGKFYVEYTYNNKNGVRIVNHADKFPEAVALHIYAYFRDKCNENTVYSGKIICPKAKLNPEQVELALTSTGKHGFEFTMMREYCAEEGEDEMFTIIVSA